MDDSGRGAIDSHLADEPPATRTPGLREAVLNIATLIGWLLSTIFVLSFARMSRPT